MSALEHYKKAFVNKFRSIITCLLADLFPSHIPECHSVKFNLYEVMLCPPVVVPAGSRLTFAAIERLWSYESLKANVATRPFVNLVDAIVFWLHRQVNEKGNMRQMIGIAFHGFCCVFHY